MAKKRKVEINIEELEKGFKLNEELRQIGLKRREYGLTTSPKRVSIDGPWRKK